MRILNHGVKRWWQIDHVFKARQKRKPPYRGRVPANNCTKHRRSKQKTTDERRVRSHERHLTLRYHTTWQCSTRYDFENNILLGLGNIVEVERGTVLVVVEYPRKVPWKRKTFIVKHDYYTKIWQLLSQQHHSTFKIQLDLSRRGEPYWVMRYNVQPVGFVPTTLGDNLKLLIRASCRKQKFPFIYGG